MKLKTRIPTLIPLMAIAIAALGQTAASQTRDERAIRAASEARQRYVTTQNVDSIVALHTPDAVVMPSNAPLMKGSSAIRSGWTEMLKTDRLRLHLIPTRIEVASPTLATEYGIYTESYNAPGGKMNEAGNYVTIWRKVNGKWRVTLDAPVSTTPMPAQMPAEASDFVARNGSALSWSDFAPPGFPAGGCQGRGGVSMTANQYRAAIANLGLSQVGAARFFEVGDRTSRRWISGEYPIPPAVDYCLRLMIKHNVKPSDLAKVK